MQVRIKGYAFTLSEPYSEGHTLTRGEAQALNALRVENINNNLRKLVATEVAKLPDPELLLSPETLQALQAEIGRYDRQYSFGERVAATPRRGDLEIEARNIARELVLSRLREQGIDPSEEDLELFVDQVATTPAVVEAAHAAATAKRQALTEGLQELLEQ